MALVRVARYALDTQASVFPEPPPRVVEGSLAEARPPCAGLEEDNGARSNPRLQLELAQLTLIHERLLAKAAARPRKPRHAPPRASPVLETVTCVLERAGEPMRARDIYAAAEQLAGEALRWTSVKAALAAGAASRTRRFERIRRGVSQRARPEGIGLHESSEPSE